MLLLEIARDAERVIAWMFTAMAIAAMLFPVVMGLARVIPRVLAVIVVAVCVLGSIGFLGYRTVHDVANETDRLRTEAPRRAAELERNSEFLREIKLRSRVEHLVDEIPQRLAGGQGTEIVKSAATRGVAFLAGTILTIFFVLYGPNLLAGAIGQVDDEHRRVRIERVLHEASGRALVYARIKVLQVLVQGFLAFTIARLAGAPGAAALGVWAGLWALVPLAGVVVGALPIVAFAGAASTSRAIVVTAVFAVIALGDWWLNHELQRTTVKVGSFVVVFAAFAGLELYGLMGALLAILGAVLVTAIVGEIGPEEVAEVISAPRGGGHTLGSTIDERA